MANRFFIIALFLAAIAAMLPAVVHSSMDEKTFLGICDQALVGIAQTEDVILQFGGRDIRSGFYDAAVRAPICKQFFAACARGQKSFSFPSPTPELGKNEIECSEVTGGATLEKAKTPQEPVKEAQEKEKDCSQYPNSYPEAGGCKCKDGYKPDLQKNSCVPASATACQASMPHSLWDDIRKTCVCKSPYVLDKDEATCLLAEAKEAQDIIEELTEGVEWYEHKLAGDPTAIAEWLGNRLAEKPPPSSRGLTERFFNRRVPLLPKGAMKKLAKRFTDATGRYRDVLSKIKIKLQAAKADLDAGQHGSAAIAAKEAKELMGGVSANEFSASACAVNAIPRITKQGAYTVIPSLELQPDCDCNLLDMTIMKRTLRVYGPVPKETYTPLATISACQAVVGDIVNVPDPLDDIVINDHYGKRGLLLLYWTSAWLYGDIKVK